jgi:hypothetical protein
MDLNEPRYSVSATTRKLQVHISTTWRYLLHGVRGKKLKSYLVGGRRYILHRDLVDFLSPANNEPTTTQPAATPHVTAASKELDCILRGKSRKRLRGKSRKRRLPATGSEPDQPTIEGSLNWPGRQLPRRAQSGQQAPE